MDTGSSSDDSWDAEMTSRGSNISLTMSLSMHESALYTRRRPSSPPPAPPPRPPIAPKGELILLVGPEARELRVHALILANASPVFASMLQPSGAVFNECAAVQAATATHPARVPLPEDDPAAVETICRVLHGRTLQGEPASLGDMSTREVLAVAVVADKYDCAPAMAPVVEQWLAPAKFEGMMAAARDGCLGFRRCDLLLASYWFKNEKVFEEATRMLIVEVKGGFEGVVEEREGDWVEEQLAWKLALALESKRNDLRLSLYRTVVETMYVFYRDFGGCKRRPSWAFMWRGKLARFKTMATDEVLRSIDRETLPGKLGGMSIGQVMRTAAEVPAIAFTRIPTLREQYNPDAPRGERGVKPFYKRMLEKDLEDWRKKRLRGLCLACLHPQMKCEGCEGKGEWWC